MELRLCMFEHRRRYGVTFMHIAAPAIIWTYVYAYASAAGELENVDVAVANVSFAFSFAFRRCRFRTLSGDFVRRNKYFLRASNSSTTFGTAHVMVSVLGLASRCGLTLRFCIRERRGAI